MSIKIKIDKHLFYINDIKCNAEENTFSLYPPGRGSKTFLKKLLLDKVRFKENIALAAACL